MRLFLRGLWFFAAIFTFFAVFISSTLAGSWILFDYVSLIPQWVYLVTLIPLLVSGMFMFQERSRLYLLIPSVALLMGFLFLFDIVWFHKPQPPIVNSRVVHVVSWNTNVWNRVKEPRMFTEMQRHPADIYVLQEVSFKGARGIEERAPVYFPGYYVSHTSNFLLLSRFPIMSTHSVDGEGFSRSVVSIYNTQVAVYNVHFTRPFYMDEFRRYDDFEARHKQFSSLQNMLIKERMPVLIAGDFNAPRNYPWFSWLEDRYTLNNPTSWFTMPRTFWSQIPVFRIDYQFASEELPFVSYKEFSIPSLSDHSGIEGEFTVL
jgi:endonuclease/exonuclease/phosphatase family metal-dependent hydrolase